MAIVAIFEAPGMTQEDYDRITDKLTGGNGTVKSPSDWPVAGLRSHVAAPTPDGWFVADVWESEDAFRQFGDTLMPILQEAGFANLQPRIYQAHNVVVE